MAATSSFGNGTTIMSNTTENFLFCLNMPVGPIIWAVFSVLAACVGLPASVWLLWLLVQRQRSGLTSDTYMLNLTIMDLIYNLFRLPDLLNYFVWRDSQLLLEFYLLEGLNFNGRPLLMACSCVDCYMAVVHPIRYMKISKSRYRTVVCALVWVSTLGFGLLYRLGKNVIPISVWKIPCVLGICTITFCDIIILRTLRKPDPSRRSEVHPQKQRALQTITNSFIMTLLSYLPMLLSLILIYVVPFSPQETFCQIYVPSLISSMVGSTILPLLCLNNLGSLKALRVCVCI